LLFAYEISDIQTWTGAWHCLSTKCI